MSVTNCVFDAYGTLFDVAAAARRVAQRPDFPAFAARVIRDFILDVCRAAGLLSASDV